MRNSSCVFSRTDLWDSRLPISISGNQRDLFETKGGRGELWVVFFMVFTCLVCRVEYRVLTRLLPLVGLGYGVSDLLDGSKSLLAEYARAGPVRRFSSQRATSR